MLQSPRIAYRGQIVAVVVAERAETAREARMLIGLDIEEEPHEVVLRAGDERLYAPEKVNPDLPTDTADGDVDAALAVAPASIDVTYETPWLHINPMEPHAAVARWDDDRRGLTVHDSTQGSAPAADTLAAVFRLDRERVRVISHHVGGGFGSKGRPRPIAVVAGLAALVTGRTVKAALSRREMFALSGYRTPTIQRLRLGAERDGTLTAIAHDVVEQTSSIDEFAEQTATATRMMYAAPNRRTTHRLAALDVPTPSWMRAPGECPGMFALESALDELAQWLGIDPIELRVRNEPAHDPESGQPFSSRGLVACLREGARRFGWDARDPAPASRRDGRWMIGTGVAASTYPARTRPSQALARREPGGRYLVAVSAADIGTGARTVLAQIAADALGVDLGRVRVELGDSALPPGPVAGGSAGTASWGTAVHAACCELRDDRDAAEARVDTAALLEARPPRARHAFGAQFAEVRVDVETGEVRLARMLGVFAAGRIVNATLARSQLIGGMTMGVGMALTEAGRLDGLAGKVVGDDLAAYHVPTYADVPSLEADWIEEDDPDLNPIGVKGIGEIGIVGAAAAIGNAVHHACGLRVRRLPIRVAAILDAGRA